MRHLLIGPSEALTRRTLRRVKQDILPLFAIFFFSQSTAWAIIYLKRQPSKTFPIVLSFFFEQAKALAFLALKRVLKKQFILFGLTIFFSANLRLCIFQAFSKDFPGFLLKIIF
jgi:hypothetical protein